MNATINIKIIKGPSNIMPTTEVAILVTIIRTTTKDITQIIRISIQAGIIISTTQISNIKIINKGSLTMTTNQTTVDKFCNKILIIINQQIM